MSAPKEYLFVSNRDVIVSSLQGYRIVFTKGVPIHVPKPMHAEVIEKGILPVAADGKEDLAEMTRIAEEAERGPRIVVAPETSEDRAEAIKSAVKAIAERNRSEDFTAGGVPSTAAVSAALGWKVDLKEIRPVWTEFKRQTNELE